LTSWEEAGEERVQCRPGVPEDTTCTFTTRRFCAEDLEGADRLKYRNACSGNIGGQTTIIFEDFEQTSNKFVFEGICQDIPRNPRPLGGIRQARQLAFTSP